VTETPRGTRHSGDIEVGLYRQILLIPFAVETAAGSGNRLASGRDRIDALARLLAGSPWKEITADRWRHLPAGDGDGLAESYAEFVYFEPYVQRYLFGTIDEKPEDAPIRLWRRTDLQALDVVLPGNLGSAPGRYRLRVDRMNLYLFDTGNVMLVVELAHDESLACDIADGSPDPSTLARIMALTEHVRRVFPPAFVGEAAQGADRPALFFPTSLHWATDATAPLHESPPVPAASFLDFVKECRAARLHPAWRDVLAGLPIEGEPSSDDRPPVHLSLLGDDRAFSMTIMQVDDIGAVSEPDWVRIAMCDGPGVGWPYSRAFLDGWERRQTYDRHFDAAAGSGTRYLLSGYSFAMVGSTPGPEETDLFRNVFVGHGRRHYFQLALIAYFQKAALVTLSERLSDAMSARPRAPEVVEAIEQDILQFSTRYWFETLSAQVQAQELFDLLRENLRLRPLYDQIRREARQAGVSEAAREQRRLAHNQNRLNLIAGVGLPLTIISGILGMNVFSAGDNLQWPLTWLTIFLIVGAVGSLFVALYGWSDSLERRFAESGNLTWAYLSVPVVILAIGTIGLWLK